MRLAEVTKLISIAVVVVAAFGASTALADDGCLQACADQFVLDKQACLDTYNQALADAQAAEDACLELPLAQQPACLKNVDKDRKAAKANYKNCLAHARAAYNHCIEACQVTPTAP